MEKEETENGVYKVSIIVEEESNGDTSNGTEYDGANKIVEDTLDKKDAEETKVNEVKSKKIIN